jgi:REP element-mobilizing transposase RayT
MRRYRIFGKGTTPHFITWTITGWLPIFLSDSYCSVITNSLEYCRREKGLLVNGYVIMPTHVHAIVSSSDGSNLSDILRDARKFTAKEIVRHLKNDGNKLFDWFFRDSAKKDGRPEGSYKVWEGGFHPEALESEKFVVQKLEYIHQNPVRKGLVEKQEYWKYSSAGFYINNIQGPMDFDAFEF